MKKLTPAQQQYTELKQQHNDCLLFFRLWDFYELFHDDARTAHKVLWITLTARNKNAPNPIPMAWIPHHALEKYLPLLIAAWYKVALAEQVWLPQPWKVVERKVVQVITPGTYIWTQTDEQFILAITHNSEWYHIAWWDFTLGSYFTKTYMSFDDLLNNIENNQIVEVVISSECNWKQDIIDYFDEKSIPISMLDVPYDTDEFIQQQLQVKTLAWYWAALTWWRSSAIAMLFSYLHDTQKTSIWAVYSIMYSWNKDTMHLDSITIKNLELFQSSYEWTKEQSLFNVIDTCNTAMWSRMLASWMREPLKDTHKIKERSSSILYYIDEENQRLLLSKWLKQLPDLPRLLTSIIYKKPSPLKIQALQHILWPLFEQEVLLEALRAKWWLDGWTISQLNELFDYLKNTLKEWTIYDTKDFIAQWFDNEVDRLRQIAYESDDLLINYQQYLVSASWVSNVKVTYIKNQGYSLEVTPKDIDQFETIITLWDEKLDLVRTQSLKWGQRYVSSYLSELQNSILQASDKLIEREWLLLQEIILVIRQQYEQLLSLSHSIWLIDVFTSHAQFAQSHNRTSPDVTEHKKLNIIWWKHPVVEKYLSHTDQFIPNDLSFSKNDFFHLVTWPNMWWKSTYLRQNAIIVLLSHMWCMVPAQSASIPLIDWIFARVWSWDALAKNQSTFMTEMTEMANILHHATSKSFVILDELWRWTSTYDGLALAKAITVYMCQDIWSYVLFATHYHELTKLEWASRWLSNWRVDVSENNDTVLFLKKIVQWGASKSYWIDVAKFAWLPQKVTAAAQVYLEELEKNKVEFSQKPNQITLFEESLNNENDNQLSIDILKKIADIQLNETSPIDLMKIIQEMQQEISDNQ